MSDRGQTPCGGPSRRHFLRAAAGGAAAAAAMPGLAPAQEAVAPGRAVPTATLGRTGEKVTILGMGTSWAIAPSFVQAAIVSGVRYIDTSETYENTRAEKTLGDVLDRTGFRKDLYLVTKIAAYRKTMGTGTAKLFEDHLNASLSRLKTDHVDCYYLHGLAGNQIELLRDPGVKAAFEALRKQGKTRFFGLSCHDARLPEILEAAAECGWIDQVMFKYNFRDIGGKDRHDDLQRAIDKATKANLGLVAMKTQDGAGNFPDKMADLQAKGFKKEVAAVKTVWLDGRIQVAVSEMTTRSDLRENVAASRDKALTARDRTLLEEHRQRTAHLYCHGCGHLCETAAKGVPVATVLRYLRYYEVYGKRQEARALYQALPPEARALAASDLAAAADACPHGLPVVELVHRADRQMGLREEHRHARA
ncbi:2,5-diketo-D-gluconate reductase B [Aquisphaera giovannonii]|uniref:2,5-diketo-D-gluconate reductase B n=1 Tax=Aquisphaera giovannonii TaxID=406548 RepID=A0A5B9WBR7_9BACT|nr:aldo/keto reductase [Aquisphaera giovannonii]QEH37475.1 2,5-diketo-D-gluconate reductase B [Aquisphaera giovannonii]